MLSCYDFFLLYKAVRLHYISPKYDGFSYNWRTRGSSLEAKAKFDQTGQFFVCKRIVQNHNFSVKNQALEFLFSNFMLSDKDIGFVGDLSDEYFMQWLKYRDSFYYRFNEDVKRLAREKVSFNRLLTPLDNEYPPVVNLSLYGEISFITVVVLDVLTNFIENCKLENDILFPEIKKRILKSKPFFFVNTEKTKKIILDNLF